MTINNRRLFIEQVMEPKVLAPWIHHQHSLTDKLKSIKCSVQLKVLSQQWVCPTWWDKFFLQIDAGRLLQREIIMCSQDVAFWYARTVIPQKCYELNPDFFKRLEGESLRNLIFEGNQVHRVQLTSYPVDHRSLEFHWVRKYIEVNERVLWVRFSEYSYEHLESFYLMELLLPELETVEE